MQLKSALIATALSACAAADFVVVTARPTPTNLNDLLNVCTLTYPGRPTLNSPA
jgi:MinD superfamily P-loop ATPase